MWKIIYTEKQPDSAHAYSHWRLTIHRYRTCGKRFVVKGDHTAHMVIHTEDKPHQCII